MKRSRLTIALVLLALIATAVPVAAQTSEPVFAYIKEGNVWLRYDNGQNVALTNDAVYQTESAIYWPGYSELSWSPTGQWLAFVRDDQEDSTLYIADVTKDVIVAEPTVSTAFPPVWYDEQNVAYFVSTGEMNQMDERYDVFTLNAGNDAHPVYPRGEFWFGWGCGGGTSDPSQILYGRETASLNGDYLIFDFSGTLIIHSINCTGSGVAAYDMDTQTDTVISENLTRAAVSPDKFLLAGILPTATDGISTIEIYNLANLGAAPRQVTASDIAGTTAAQLAWDVESTDLYYSLQQLEGDDTSSVIRTYFSGLRHYNLTTDTVARVYTASAYVFTNIAPLDGNNVLFTQIDNATTWYELLQQGKSEADLAYNLPRTYIVQVTLDPAGSAILIEDAGRVAVRPQAE
jgi:dipeptidyl aminopeptidase/acylaminoacyl peptidase